MIFSFAPEDIYNNNIKNNILEHETASLRNEKVNV